MGNILKQTYIDEYGEVIKSTTDKIYSPFKEDVGYNFKYKSNNVRSYLDTELPKEFSTIDAGRIYRLSKKIYGSSNLLAKRKKGKIVPLSKEEIQEVVEITNRSRFSTFWNKLIKNKIVKQITIDMERYYCINPIYFNSTKYLPLYLYIAFQDELNKMLPKWVIDKYLAMERGNR